MPDIGNIEYNDFDIKFNFENILFNILYIRYVPTRKDWYVKNHCHSSYELHFVTKGGGTLKVNQTMYDLSSGTIYLTGPGIFHEQITNQSDPMDEYCINFDFKVLDKRSGLKDISTSEDIDHIISLLEKNNFWFGKEYEILDFMFKRIFSELENKMLGYDLSIKSLLQQIIMAFVRCLAKETKSKQSIPQKSLDDRRRLILDWYLGGEAPELLPLEELAKIMSLSTRQLNRIIKEYYSMNFKEKLINTKLENSKHLLRYSNMQLNEIAVMSGFSSISYYCYMFKKHEGITPTQYRNIFLDKLQ